MSADSADKILSSDWIVSLNLCSNWLVNLLKEEFQKWRQTDKQTNKQTSWSDSLLNCLLSQLKRTMSFAIQTQSLTCGADLFVNYFECFKLGFFGILKWINLSLSQNSWARDVCFISQQFSLYLSLYQRGHLYVSIQG